MNLHSPSPYWLLRHGIINSYPSLNHDVKTDIAIIGAGISGAFVANELCRAGYQGDHCRPAACRVREHGRQYFLIAV